MLDMEHLDNNQLERDLNKLKRQYRYMTDKMLRLKVGGNQTKRGQKVELKKNDIIIVKNVPVGNRTSVKVKFPNSENTYKMDEIFPVITGADLTTPTKEPVGRESEKSKVG